jgi:hypothetical protein
MGALLFFLRRRLPRIVFWRPHRVRAYADTLPARCVNDAPRYRATQDTLRVRVTCDVGAVRAVLDRRGVRA